MAKATEEKLHRKMETVSDLNEWLAWLGNAQRNGDVDAKTADAINTTLKSAIVLNVKHRLDYEKLKVQAAIKKLMIPRVPMLEA